MNNQKPPTSYRILIESPLVGRWRNQYFFSSVYGLVRCVEEYHFHSNGTLFWGYQEAGNFEQTESMRYIVDDKTITLITRFNICSLVRYHIEENQMTMYFEDTESNASFTRVEESEMTQ